MNNRDVLQAALDKCELYLGNKKIEKTNMKQFEQFILDNLFSKNKLAYVSIIPNDKCLSYIFLIAGIVAYINNSQSVDDYIQELIETAREDCHFKVTYGGRIYKLKPKFSQEDELCLVNHKNKLTTRVQRKCWNQILDYAGNAKNRVKHYQRLKSRVDFYRAIFGNASLNKPVVFDDISYIVVDRKRANRILDKLYIEAQGIERKKFSEMFTVSYQNRDADEVFKYSGSLGEAYPSIGICSDLATVKKWSEEYGKDYPITMLYVADWSTIQRDKGFIQQIFDNQMISLQMYNFFFRFSLMEEVRHLQEADAYWGTTPTYLEQNPDFSAIVTANIFGTITTRYFPSSIIYREYHDIVQKLRILRKQKDNSSKGFEFMCHAIGLIRRLRTDCFCMEDAFIDPYKDSISHLKIIQESIYDSAVKNLCSEICIFVERLYEDIVKNQCKYKRLKEILSDNPHGNKLLVVPYYRQCNAISLAEKGKYHLDIATPLKMRDRKNYDLIIVSGTFSLRDVPVFLHLHAERTVFFLYEFEKPDYEKLVGHAQKQLHDFEVLAGIVPDDGNISENDDTSEAVWDESLAYVDISEIINRFHPASAGSDIVQERKIEVVRLGLLDDGRQYLFSKKKVNYLNQEENKVQPIEVDKLVPGMSFLYCRDFGNRHDIINAILKEEKENSDDFQQAVALVNRWKSCLVSYMKEHKSSWNDLSRQIGIMGYPNSGGAIIRSWVMPESYVIGPRDKGAYQAIKRTIASYDGDTTAETYQKATETVRSIHNIITKKITRILPRVYEDTQRGIKADTPVKKMLQEDLDEFVEVLNLSDVQSLKQGAMIPGNYVNVPLESEELTNFE